MPARLLALDSSTESLAVAVGDGDRAWTRTVPGGAQASAQILVLAFEGLAELGLAVAQLDAVAFAAGPGAFTGLRCACAVAQGLAFAVGKPVLAIDSLMVVAEGARQLSPGSVDDLWVAMDARMQEIYAARYRAVVGGDHEVFWQVLNAPALYTVPALAARWRAEPPRAVAGSALTVCGESLPTGAALPLAVGLDRAAALLALARQAFAAGAGVAPQDAAPLYLRDKVALTIDERAATRRAPASRA